MSSDKEWALATSEVESPEKRDSRLWARCLAEQGGDEAKAKAAYVRSKATGAADSVFLADLPPTVHGDISRFWAGPEIAAPPCKTAKLYKAGKVVGGLCILASGVLYAMGSDGNPLGRSVALLGLGLAIYVVAEIGADRLRRR